MLSLGSRRASGLRSWRVVLGVVTEPEAVGTAAAAARQAVAKELVAEEAVTEAVMGGQAVMGCIAGDGVAAGSTAAGVIAEKALEERLASSSNSTSISGGSDVPPAALRCAQPGDGTALIGGRCCNSQVSDTSIGGVGGGAGGAVGGFCKAAPASWGRVAPRVALRVESSPVAASGNSRPCRTQTAASCQIRS